MAFMAKVSDPFVGASYMTLLTTLVSFAAFNRSLSQQVFLSVKFGRKKCKNFLSMAHRNHNLEILHLKWKSKLLQHITSVKCWKNLWRQSCETQMHWKRRSMSHRCWRILHRSWDKCCLWNWMVFCWETNTEPSSKASRWRLEDQTYHFDKIVVCWNMTMIFVLWVIAFWSRNFVSVQGKVCQCFQVKVKLSLRFRCQKCNDTLLSILTFFCNQ